MISAMTDQIHNLINNPKSCISLKKLKKNNKIDIQPLQKLRSDIFVSLTMNQAENSRISSSKRKEKCKENWLLAGKVVPGKQKEVFRRKTEQ